MVQQKFKRYIDLFQISEDLKYPLLNAVEVTGSLKDFSYLFSNNLDISLQLSCCKYPKSFFLVEEWENNKESLLTYLEQVQMGVKGLVSREGNTLQPGAEVIVWNPDGSRRAKSVLTSEDGEYWRLLLPNVAGNNTFTVQVSGGCYQMSVESLISSGALGGL